MVMFVFSLHSGIFVVINVAINDYVKRRSLGVMEYMTETAQ